MNKRVLVILCAGVIALLSGYTKSDSKISITNGTKGPIAVVCVQTNGGGSQAGLREKPQSIFVIPAETTVNNVPATDPDLPFRDIWFSKSRDALAGPIKWNNIRGNNEVFWANIGRQKRIFIGEKNNKLISYISESIFKKQNPGVLTVVGDAQRYDVPAK